MRCRCPRLIGFLILFGPASACSSATTLAGDAGDDRTETAGDEAAAAEEAATPDDAAAPEEALDAEAGDEVPLPDVADDGGGEEAEAAPEAPDADDGGGDEAGDGACPVASHWELEPRTIRDARLVDGPAPRYGTTDRVLVGVQLTSECDRLGRVDVDVTPGGATDFAELRAWAWVPRGTACGPSAPVVEWVVLVDGRHHGNFRVVVTDGHSPGGGLRLEYEREIACSGVPECACGPGAPAGARAEGDACLTDCSCATGLSCIGGFGFAGEYWACLRPCNDFRECRAPEACPARVFDAAPYVCMWAGDGCTTDVDCPAGYVCAESDRGRFCRDGRTGPSRGACVCDEECPVGHLCAVGASPTPVCEIPCLENAHCPSGGSAPLCGPASTCEAGGPTLTIRYEDPCPCFPPPCCPTSTFSFAPGTGAAWFLMCGDAVACFPPPVGWERQAEDGTWERVVSPGESAGAGFQCAPETFTDPWMLSVPTPPSGTVRAVALFDGECGPDPVTCATRCGAPFEVLSNAITVP